MRSGARSATTTANLTGRSSGPLEDVKPAANEEVSVQALRLTLQSMAAHPEMPLVQEYGCGTLYNLSLATPALRSKITADGGVPIVLHAMRSHPMVTGVQINACALVKELAEFQPALQILEEGGGRALLLAALQHHQFNDDLLARATEALRYLPEEIPLPDE